MSVRVKNDSAHEGDEVVQLYFTEGKPDEAIRTLRGFQRVHLRPNETRTLEFVIGVEDLPKDKVRISVGGGQPVGQIPHLEAVL